MKYIELVKKNGKKVLSAVLCMAMVAIGAVLITPVGAYAEGNNPTLYSNDPAMFDYNGYPYGIINGSEIQLNVALKGGITADTVEWYRSDSKGGEYTKVDGATGLSYTFTAVDGTADWYKCRVNGYDTEAVQVIHAKYIYRCDAASYDATAKEIQVFNQSSGANAWYISNGAMAYTNGYMNDNIPEFDVIGTYVYQGDEAEGYKGKTIWISTSYCYGSSEYGWQMMDGVKHIIITFDRSNEHSANCYAELDDGQSDFSIYADVCLGSYTLFKGLADSASLNAVMSGDILSQVQMVSAKSVADANDSDAAFVLQCVNSKPSTFYIGGYGAAKNNYKEYNKSINNCFSYTKIGNDNVVTEAKTDENGNSIDTGLAIRWTDIQDRVVNFNFNIGSASQAGAQIKTNSETTSTTVTVTQEEGEIGTIQFRLYDKTNDSYTDWITPDADTKKAVFKDLTPNHTYEVQSKKINETDDKAQSRGDVTTAIDPLNPGAGSGETRPVESTVTTDSITLKNLNAEYQYRLLDENNNEVAGWKSPSGNDNSIVFSGLQSGRKYYLVAKTDDNSLTEKVEYIIPSQEDIKNAAKAEIEKAVTEAKAAIDAMPDLSTQEATAAKNKIDEYQNSALETIEQATALEQIEEAKNTCINSIKAEQESTAAIDLSNAKNNSKAEIAAAVSDAKAKIDAMNNLSSDEKNKAKADIDNKADEIIKSIDAITDSSAKADITTLKQLAIKEIEKIKADAAGKKNEEDNKGNGGGSLPTNPSTKEDDDDSSVDNDDTNSQVTKPELKYEDIKDNVVKPEEEFKYGNGNIKVIVDSKIIEDDKTIDGFFVTSYENIINACLSDSDKKKVSEGQSVEIRLTLTDIKDAVPEEDKNLIESQMAQYTAEKPGLTFGQYIDLNLEMRIGNEQWKKIPHANQEIEITIEIPDNLKMDGVSYSIIRCHDGVCTLLEDLDDNADTITIKTDRFSTYALVYNNNSVAKAPKTGDTNALALWIVLAFAALLSGTTVAAKSKK